MTTARPELSIPEPLAAMRLLEPDEPAPVMRRAGREPVALRVRRRPRRPAPAAAPRRPRPRRRRPRAPHRLRHRHPAGRAGARRARFDAPLVAQTYSRLVIDCNRPTHVAQSIPEISELTAIPGNLGSRTPARRPGSRRCSGPITARSRRCSRRARRQAPTVLIAMHSFTPVFQGVARPWLLGLLYNRDARLAGRCSIFEPGRAPRTSATGCPTRSRTRATTPCRCTASAAACRMSGSRSART